MAAWGRDGADGPQAVGAPLWALWAARAGIGPVAAGAPLARSLAVSGRRLGLGLPPFAVDPLGGGQMLPLLPSVPVAHGDCPSTPCAGVGLGFGACPGRAVSGPLGGNSYTP